MDSEAIKAQVFFAKLAEQSERFSDMAKIMKELVEQNTPLSIEGRNLLSVAYKNVIGSRRSAWRSIGNTDSAEKGGAANAACDLLKIYRERIESEIKETSMEILKLLDEHLIKDSATPEDRIFFLKMKGDYERYVAEVASGEERKAIATKSMEAYKQAYELAETELSVTHPIRLGLVLNYSVFYYEIVNEPTKACELAKQAFDNAIAGLDDLSEESYKDSTLIMQLLRDNLTLWTSEMEVGDGVNQSPEKNA